MFLHEAVSEAIVRKMCITRAHLARGGRFKIYPTDTSACCIIYNDEKGLMTPRWQPNASDLLADDWVLVPKN